MRSRPTASRAGLRRTAPFRSSPTRPHGRPSSPTSRASCSTGSARNADQESSAVSRCEPTTAEAAALPDRLAAASPTAGGGRGPGLGRSASVDRPSGSWMPASRLGPGRRPPPHGSRAATCGPSLNVPVLSAPTGCGRRSQVEPMLSGGSGEAVRRRSGSWYGAWLAGWTGRSPVERRAERTRPRTTSGASSRSGCRDADVASDLHERSMGAGNSCYTCQGSSPSPRTASAHRLVPPRMACLPAPCLLRGPD
jgi:hypothetical protein